MAPEHRGVPPPPISFVVKVTAKGVLPAFWGHNPPRPEGTVLNTGPQQAAILTLSEPSGSACCRLEVQPASEQTLDWHCCHQVCGGKASAVVVGQEGSRVPWKRSVQPRP